MPLDLPETTVLDPEAGAGPSRDKRVKAGLINSDIHPAHRSLADIRPYLSARWWEQLQAYGLRPRHGSANGEPYPKAAPLACRRDAWPEDGGRPGSSLKLMQEQLLDPFGIEHGVLGPLGPTGQSEMNPEFSAAMCAATNDWQRDFWTRREPRLKAGLVVPYEHTTAAVAEIERCGPDKDFAQVFILARTCEPAGSRRYWPVYEAAAAHNLPVSFHVFGTGGHSVSGAGWPSYYIEEGAGHSTACQAAVSSLVMEGVFERFPNLKVVMIEGGFGWLPPLTWRLDKLFERHRAEVPHLKRKPSEYIKQHIWISTQPMEEPEDRRHLLDTIEWIGWDRLLFASDYPHWDFDDPTRVFPAGTPKEGQQKVLTENGRNVFRLG